MATRTQVACVDVLVMDFPLKSALKLFILIAWPKRDLIARELQFKVKKKITINSKNIVARENTVISIKPQFGPLKIMKTHAYIRRKYVPLDILTFDLQDRRLGSFNHTNVDELVGGQAGVQLRQHGSSHLFKLELSHSMIHWMRREVHTSHDKCVFVPKKMSLLQHRPKDATTPCRA